MTKQQPNDLQALPCFPPSSSRQRWEGKAEARLVGGAELSVDDSVVTKVDVTALCGDSFDGGSVAIGAYEVCGVDGLEGRAPRVR